MGSEDICWQIIQDATDEEIAEILEQDRVWNCFALADLELPLRDYSQFIIAKDKEGKGEAICLTLRHPIIGEVISPFGDEEGIAAILKKLPLPEKPSIQVQEKLLPCIQRYYGPETSWKSLWRMAMNRSPEEVLPIGRVQEVGVQELVGADLPALKDLYGRYPESLFSADLFGNSFYVGIYEGERIVAAGGTHALVERQGIAVLGHILTAREVRRRGYATEITARLVEKLVGRGYGTIVLNVFEENEGAMRIYKRLGFGKGQRMFTGRGILRKRDDLPG